MYLNRLKIRNFRCFSHYEVEFAPRVTVLFGKNGTGKTTLIHAIHKALSFMMHSEHIKEKNPKTGKQKVVATHSIIKGNPYLKVEGFAKQGDWHTIEDPLIEISAEGSLPAPQIEDLRLLLNWSISAYTDKLTLRRNEYRDAFRAFYGWYERNGELPLLCYISDSFPHIEDIHHKQLKKKISDYPSFGYYNWNEESGNTKEWVGRLENDIREIDRTERKIRTMEEIAYNPYEKDEDKIATFKMGIEEDKAKIEKLRKEVKYIESIIRNFASRLEIDGKLSMNIASIGLHPDDDRLCLHMVQGKPKSFRHLPAGYQRLFSIVLDVAFRSYFLNNMQEADSHGIVIVDEIDLHLHPELEKVVLNALIETFPQLQFIVSTHSPMVLSGLKTTDGRNKILRMVSPAEAPIEIHDVYGLDYNSMVQEIMDVGASDPELQRLIARCAYLYKNHYTEQGNALKSQIIQQGMLRQGALERRIEDALRELE